MVLATSADSPCSSPSCLVSWTIQSVEVSAQAPECFERVVVLRNVCGDPAQEPAAHLYPCSQRLIASAAIERFQQRLDGRERLALPSIHCQPILEPHRVPACIGEEVHRSAVFDGPDHFRVERRCQYSVAVGVRAKSLPSLLRGPCGPFMLLDSFPALGARRLRLFPPGLVRIPPHALDERRVPVARHVAVSAQRCDSGFGCGDCRLARIFDPEPIPLGLGAFEFCFARLDPCVLRIQRPPCLVESLCEAVLSAACA